MSKGNTKETRPRTLTGKVVSDKMDKSIVIEVVRRVKHELYGRYIKKSKKFHAHDQDNACSSGDIVKIVECAPVSKTKTWMLDTIIEKAN